MAVWNVVVRFMNSMTIVYTNTAKIIKNLPKKCPLFFPPSPFLFLFRHLFLAFGKNDFSIDRAGEGKLGCGMYGLLSLLSARKRQMACFGRSYKAKAAIRISVQGALANRSNYCRQESSAGVPDASLTHMSCLAAKEAIKALLKACCSKLPQSWNGKLVEYERSLTNHISKTNRSAWWRFCKPSALWGVMHHEHPGQIWPDCVEKCWRLCRLRRPNCKLSPSSQSRERCEMVSTTGLASVVQRRTAPSKRVFAPTGAKGAGNLRVPKKTWCL